MCGGLKWRAVGEPLMQGICHCRTCQRLTGGGHTGFITLPEESVSFEGETRTIELPGGSGKVARRFACAKCQSIVCGRAEVMPGRVNLYAGSLDEPARFKPTLAIFVRSRPPWDQSSRDLACYDTLPGR